MTLRLVPENIHELRLGGRRVVMHPPTSALFELDEVGAAVIDLFRSRDAVAPEDVVRAFDGRVAAATVTETLGELSRLDMINPEGRASVRPMPPIRELPLNTVVLNVNTGCNLSCTYCYKEDLTDAAHGRVMELDTARQAIDTVLAERGGDGVLNVVFFGGEPLTRLPMIRQVVEYATARCTELGRSANFSLTTNGTLLTPAVIDYLEEHRFGVTVSMDGPAALHDRNRVTNRGRGSYAIIVPKVRDLLSRYRARPVGARVTLTRGVTDVVTIHHHLRDELGFHEVGFSPVTSGPGTDFNLTGDDLAAVFAGFRTLGEEYRLAARAGRDTGFSNLHQLMTDLYEGRRKSLPCGAGLGMVAVDAGGDFHLCHRFTGSKLPTFGNVREGVDRERLDGFLAAAGDLSGRGCATCRIRSLCAGGCYHESYARYGDPLKPTYHYCDLMRDWVDYGVGVYLDILENRPDFFARHLKPRRPQA